jgi:flagellar hook-associated protein 3 FlgL
MMTDNAIRNMADSLEALNKMQENVSSGKKFQVASEDPASASLSLSLKSSLRTMDDFLNTAAQANDWMSASELAYQQMEDMATRASSLIARGLTDTVGADERANSLAPEIDGMLDEAFGLANSNVNGQYIFAGYKVNAPAFEMPDRDTVTYVGDAGVMQRSMGPSKNVNINVQGDVAFTGIFKGLIDARNALTGNNTGALRTALGEIQSALSEVDKFRTLNGTRLRQVQVAQDYLERSQIETKSLLSQKEDINLAEGIALLKGQETNYQVVLEVSQRTISAMSLFDFLR